MKLKVYVETSIVSYLTARPAKDPVVAAKQECTAAWWARRHEFALFTSMLTAKEAMRGNVFVAERRIKMLDGIPIIAITRACDDVAFSILNAGILPRKAEDDAFHLAVCAVHGMDVLLTWNCKHLANGALIRRIEGVLKKQGLSAPIMCTPEQLPGAIK